MRHEPTASTTNSAFAPASFRESRPWRSRHRCRSTASASRTPPWPLKAFSSARGRNLCACARHDRRRVFDTLGIRIVDGRPFRQADGQNAPRVAVVNETFASRYWPGRRRVGRRFRTADGALGRDRRSGGQTPRTAGLSEPPTEFLYYRGAPRTRSPQLLLLGAHVRRNQPPSRHGPARRGACRSTPT